MIKEKEHWCCECYHYKGDTSIGEICDLTGESIFDSRPHNSRSCDKWEECICGPLNWEDVENIVHIYEIAKDVVGDYDKELYEEVLTRFKQIKEEQQ